MADPFKEEEGVAKRGEVLPLGVTAQAGPVDTAQREFMYPKFIWKAGRAIEDISNQVMGRTPLRTAEENVAVATEAAMGVGGTSAIVPKPAGSFGVFGGITSKTANMKAYKKAQDMVKSGASSTDIWNQTGWSLWKDGKWRYRISDVDIGLTTPDGKNISVTHLELDKAYPSLLKNAKIFYDDSLPKNVSGRFTPNVLEPDGSFEIALNRNLTKEEQMLTLVHELDHAIQFKENFTGGSSVRRQMMRNYQDFSDNLLEELEFIAFDAGKFDKEFVAKAIKNSTNFFKGDDYKLTLEHLADGSEIMDYFLRTADKKDVEKFFDVKFDESIWNNHKSKNPDDFIYNDLHETMFEVYRAKFPEQVGKTLTLKEFSEKVQKARESITEEDAFAAYQSILGEYSSRLNEDYYQVDLIAKDVAPDARAEYFFPVDPTEFASEAREFLSTYGTFYSKIHYSETWVPQTIEPLISNAIEKNARKKKFLVF